MLILFFFGRVECDQIGAVQILLHVVDLLTDMLNFSGVGSEPSN